MATLKPSTHIRLASRWTIVPGVLALALVTVGASGLRTDAAMNPSQVPNAPASVSASPDNNSALVSWTVPSSNNGSAITSYVITPYLGTDAQAQVNVAGAMQATIPGLTNGSRYTFAVAAINANGAGPTASSKTVAIGAPTAPSGVSVTPVPRQAGGARATVSWTAPTSNASPITAYVVTPFLGPFGLTPRTVPADSTSALLSGLTFGATYTFKVAAQNAYGSSFKSASSNSLTPRCVATPMLNGQSDINAAPAGTTFCLTGTHNWTLTPKSGDGFIGPAILDGANSTVYAFVGNGAANVILSAIEVRNYNVTDPQAAISAHGTTGWIFRDLQVHDNGSAGGGTGLNLGVNSRVLGGRYYNNRELGIGGGGGADGWIINGAQIDHNNFTDDTYTTRNIACGYQGGGVKWTADNTTVVNSWIIGNACKGLWADLNADNTTIVNNLVAGNWDEGIFVEISSNATVTNNIVTGNGLRNYNGDGSGCPWLWGGGITLASSDGAEVAYNSLSGNCNGITATQQNRADGNPGLLQNDSIHDNSIAGPGGKTGAVADNGANLPARNIVFANNTFSNGALFCNLQC